METKEYFEKVMQDFNQHRNGRSLRKYCQDEGIDYKWLQEYKRSYPNDPRPVQNPAPESADATKGCLIHFSSPNYKSVIFSKNHVSGIVR